MTKSELVNKAKARSEAAREAVQTKRWTWRQRQTSCSERERTTSRTRTLRWTRRSKASRPIWILSSCTSLLWKLSSSDTQPLPKPQESIDKLFTFLSAQVVAGPMERRTRKSTRLASKTRRQPASALSKSSSIAAASGGPVCKASTSAQDGGSRT